MTESRQAWTRATTIEFTTLMTCAWAAMIAIPVLLGGIGISWDALNHHIYLGWIADEPRFDRDFMAAASQSFQYPYVYWPVYKLAAADASGVTAGIVLASLHWLAAPPVWWISRQFIRGADAYAVAMRTMALLLAFLSPVVLSLFDATSNDLIATVPFVWALALALYPPARSAGTRPWLTAAFVSGALAGVSVAFKLSNGPMAVLLPLIWLLYSPPGRIRWLRSVVGGLGVVTGFALTYGPWAAQLWVHVGNPIYPFCDACFAPIRSWVGWHP
jgi:hypothetical protein